MRMFFLLYEFSGDIEVTVEFLIEMNKLVQLIESPIFACKPNEFKALFKCYLLRSLSLSHTHIESILQFLNSSTFEFGVAKYCRSAIFIACTFWYFDAVATNGGIHIAEKSSTMHSTCSGIPA